MNSESPNRTPFLFLSLSLSAGTQKRSPGALWFIGSIFNQDCNWRWLEVQEKSLNNFHINENSNMDGLNFGFLSKLDAESLPKCHRFINLNPMYNFGSTSCFDFVRVILVCFTQFCSMGSFCFPLFSIICIEICEYRFD